MYGSSRISAVCRINRIPFPPAPGKPRTKLFGNDGTVPLQLQEFRLWGGKQTCFTRIHPQKERRKNSLHIQADRFNPPAPDFLAADYAEEAPAYLFWRIETGKHIEPFYSQGSVMPAFGAYFSERQIWQLVAYLRNRAKRSTSAAQESDRTFS